MYGNVDAAIKFFKLLASHVTNKKGMNMFNQKLILVGSTDWMKKET